ncbi:unnamed protein product [Closterium sp. NIES-54]
MLPSSVVRELLKSRLLQPADIAGGPACLPPLLRAHPHVAPRIISALLTFCVPPQDGRWGEGREARRDWGRGWGGEGMGGGLDGRRESGDARGGGRGGAGGNEGGVDTAFLDEAVQAIGFSGRHADPIRNPHWRLSANQERPEYAGLYGGRAT